MASTIKAIPQSWSLTKWQHLYSSASNFHEGSNNITLDPLQKASITSIYRPWLKGGPQFVRMLQARPGRSSKQRQKQNSPNLESTCYPTSVAIILYVWTEGYFDRPPRDACYLWFSVKHVCCLMQVIDPTVGFLPRWLPLMSWMSMEGRLGVDWICTHTDSMEQRTTACPDLCAPEKFDEWGDLRWKSSAYHLCHLDQLCAHQWQSRLDHFCQEKHSLVAVKIIPVVEIILELKFISLHQNGLQDQPQLQNNFNCKWTVNLTVHWQLILIAKYPL